MTYSIWFFLWLLISIGLLGFSIWTFIILIRQKKSWRDFAKKHKLRYRNSAFMSSPRLNGVYKEYTIGIFTGEHEAERGGNNRKMTAIEVELDSRMPISGAFASGGMVGIVQEMSYSDEFVPNFKFWNSDNIAKCENKHVLEDYLDEPRAKALADLMKRKNFWVIFIFKGDDTILRIDTPDPFDSLDKLTKTIDDLIEIAKTLELRKGESKRLMTIRSKHKEDSSVVDIEEDDLALMSLELEDDEAADNNDAKAEPTSELEEEPLNVDEKPNDKKPKKKAVSQKKPKKSK